MRCIVLSGATVPFQSLVDAIDGDLVQKLQEAGFTSIEVQYGYATPPNIDGVQYFNFDSNIREKVHAAQLIISHAGTGSILDSIGRGDGLSERKVIVVVNDSLMDNHQLEVATKLEELGCIYVCKTPRALVDAISVVMHRKFANLEIPASLQAVVDEELVRKWI